MKADLVLVSCVKSKVDRPAPAKDLYMPSAWFRKARVFAEQKGKKWLILSAAHGLVDPDTVIAPYDSTLNGATVERRCAWRAMVSRQFDERERELCGGRVIILAGLNYRRGLISPLEQMYGSVEVPMEGLAMGQQLSWLGRNAA